MEKWKNGKMEKKRKYTGKIKYVYFFLRERKNIFRNCNCY
jgi:hypothetical protein